MAYGPEMARLLTVGFRFSMPKADFVLERHRLADLMMPTGQIVGCDPMLLAGGDPFTVAVAPGRYQTWAWVAVGFQKGKEWQRRVAALELSVSGGAAVRWEMAVADGQDPATLGEHEFFGYGVDAGVGGFMDATAAAILSEWDDDQLDGVLVPSVPDYPLTPVPGALTAIIDGSTGANMVCTASGWGDGVYPTFIGYEASGAVVSFVTDFMVVPRDSDKSM